MRVLRISLTVAVLAMTLCWATVAQAAAPTFILSGDGYGHGVGMSQLGAVARANLGQSATTILGAYFKGTKVSTRSELSDVRVKVDLDSSKASRSSWRIRSGNVGVSFKLNYPSTTLSDSKTPYTIKAVSGKIVLVKPTGEAIVTGKTAIELTPSSGSPRLMEVYDKSGYASRSYMRYRGTLRAEVDPNAPSRVHLYNMVTMQEYLYGVVPRELGSYYSPKLAASEVQAICARSYAYSSVMAGKALYCTTRSQVYGGYGRWYSSDRVTKVPGSTKAYYSYEESGSNSAVDATLNKCVTYNGKVIKTHFSSCNGSITANNSDVWGRTQLPYYTGVKDPSHSSTRCSHSWSVTVDGLALAKTLKSKGASVPSGAGVSVYVNALTPTYGSNGWVKKMTISWSNGSTTSIGPGDNVRIYMGLRSARFTVKKDTPDTWTTLQETSSGVRLSGPWKYRSMTGTSGGKHAYVATKSSYALVQFKGEGVAWYGTKSPSYGRAKVYVDGVYKKTINMQSSTTARKQKLYSISGLNPASKHTLKIVITTRANSTKYGNISFDCAKILNGKAVSFTSRTYQETSSLISHSSFTSVSDERFSGGKAYKTTSSGKYLTFKVKAQTVSIYGVKSPTGGRFKVYQNGVYITTVDLKSSTTSYGVKVFARRMNPARTNTIKLVTTSKAGSTKPGTVYFDRVVAYDGALK